MNEVVSLQDDGLKVAVPVIRKVTLNQATGRCTERTRDWLRRRWLCGESAARGHYKTEHGGKTRTRHADWFLLDFPNNPLFVYLRKPSENEQPFPIPK
jgi:hypothetical protein